MTFTFLFSAFAVLALSLVIALESRITTLKRTSLVGYLYKHNRAGLATSSNIGSVLSVTTVFGAMIPAAVGWRFEVVLLSLLSIPLAYTAYGLTIHRIRRNYPIRKSTTLVDLVSKPARPILRSGILAYCFVVLAMEFGVARWVMAAALQVEEAIAGMMVGYVVLVCITYTAVGGFIGVLRTDAFQLLVFILGVTWVIWLFGNDVAEIVSDVWVSTDPWPENTAGALATAAMVFGFHFATPDLWIRNASSLERSDGSADLRPLVWGAIGLCVAVLPALLVGILMAGVGFGVHGAYEASRTVEQLGRDFTILSTGSGGEQLSWYAFGIFVCILITTADTLLMTWMQHLRLAWLRLLKKRFHFALLGVGGLAFILSLFMDEWLFMFLGYFATLILFGNGAVLLLAGWSSRFNGEIVRELRLYWSIGGLLTAGICLGYDWGMQRQGILVILLQAVLAGVVFGTFSRGHKRKGDQR